LKTILLIAPEFPPNPSVGGRRWAKFAKYLAMEGYKIEVVAFAPLKGKPASNWLKDVQHSKINIHLVERDYPEILASTSNNYFIRIIKKAASVFLKLKDGGLIQDKSIFWHRHLIPKAESLIREKHIQNLIATVPPHRYSYFVVKLKAQFPDLNIIVDFRDRWLDGQVYGLEGLSEKAFRREEALQKHVCGKASFITSPYVQLLKEFEETYPNIEKKKFVHLPHSLDFGDYENLEVSGNINSKKIKFLFGGSIYTVAYKEAFSPFLQAIARLKKEHERLYALVQVEIYGDNPKLQELIKQLGIGEAVYLKNKLPEHVFFEKAAGSDFLMHFLAKDWQSLMTTKIISYLPFRKPMLVITGEGAVSEFIRENKLGLAINPTDVYEGLVKILKDYPNGFEFDQKYNFETFSFKSATQQLIKLLK
jgi:glycosyltransferase involved in cell wall biosynthesis